MEEKLIEFSLLILDHVNPYAVIIMTAYFFIFTLVGTHPVRITDEKKFTQVSAIYFRLVLLAFGFVFFLALPALIMIISVSLFNNYDYSYSLLNEIISSLKKLWPLIPLSFITPWLCVFIRDRFIKTKISKLLRMMRVRQSGDQLSDVRAEQSALSSKSFLPSKHYKQGKYFLGLDDKDQPMYVRDDVWKTWNQKIIGPTQTGKGVLMGVQIDQAIRKGQNVFFIDPKPDDFIYDIMAQACEESGRGKPIVVDLNGLGPGMYGPFINGTKRERRSRLLYAFGLNDTGQQADFYKASEREALDSISGQWDGSLIGLSKLLHPKGDFDDIENLVSSKIYEKTTRTRSYLSEMTSHKPLTAAKGRGLDIDRSIKEGAVVYVRASISDPLVIKVATVLIMDLVQSVNRVGKDKAAHTFIVIDEVKALMSDVLARGLATILSKGANMAIAFQSKEDLLSLEDKTLNAKAISSSVDINTKLTFCYQAADFETAEWAAQKSGSIQKTVSFMEAVDVNKMGGETWADKRTLNKIEENLITKNKMLQLPPRVAAVFRPNELTKMVFTSWVPVEAKGMPLKNNNAAPLKKKKNNTSIQQKFKTNKKDQPNASKKSEKNANKDSKSVDVNVKELVDYVCASKETSSKQKNEEGNNPLTKDLFSNLPDLDSNTEAEKKKG